MSDSADDRLPVRATGLTKRYGALAAVDAVDLAVGVGDVYGLLGPNGAGKTTFLRMLFGLVAPDAGEILVHGIPVDQRPVDALAGVAGFVETPRFYPYLSGRSNLQLLARLDGAKSGDRIDRALATVDLTTRADSKVAAYSYGMVQRLGIAASLIREPRLLVLDEPTNGLDPAGIRDMRALIRDLAASGITVLLSSHHMAEVEEICDRVAIMRRGRIAFDGSLGDLRAQAGRATRFLDTSDNARALSVCGSHAGVAHLETSPTGLVFEADDTTVERLSRSLVDAGLSIRTLHAPRSSLETLFFRLTDSYAGEEAA